MKLHDTMHSDDSLQFVLLQAGAGKAKLGLKEQYYHLLSDRLISPAKDHLSPSAFEALDTFFRHRLCLPSHRESRDEAIKKLQAKMRFLPIAQISRFLKMSADLAELCDTLDESLVATLEGMNLPGGAVTEADLDEAIRIENRFDERRTMMNYLIEICRIAEILCSKGFPTSVLSLVKKTVSMLGAHALNNHIDALIELSGALKGQPLKAGLDAIEAAENGYMAATFVA